MLFFQEVVLTQYLQGVQLNENPPQNALQCGTKPNEATTPSKISWFEMH